jgi:NDP-sugar pyrophosphorylase family protein
MVPVGGRPFLYWQLAALAAAGVRDFVLAVGYRADQVQAYFEDGEALGWSIAYAHEAAPLGTGGAIVNALPLLPSQFLVLNGDTFLDLDWPAFLADPWTDEGAEGCVAVRHVEDASAFGTVEHDGRRVLAFHEKRPGGGFVNAGLYWLSRAAVEHAPSPSSLERDVLPRLSLVAHPIDGDFVDIGTFDTLAAFRARMERHASQGAAEARS